MSGSAEWKPKLRCEIRRMRLLSPSRRPLFSPRRIAARMPARWRRIVRASLTNGSSFDLEAQASQASRCAGARAGAARSGDPAVGYRRIAVVDAGMYIDVTVMGSGPWSFTITPGG